MQLSSYFCLLFAYVVRLDVSFPKGDPTLA